MPAQALQYANAYCLTLFRSILANEKYPPEAYSFPRPLILLWYVIHTTVLLTIHCVVGLMRAT